MEKFHLKNELVFREEEEGGFLFDPFTGTLKCINKTAVFILKAIENTPKKKSELIKMISAEFNIDDIAIIEADIDSFISRLKELNYLKVV